MTDDDGRYWPITLDDDNLDDLHAWIDEGKLVGIVDENEGGIVAYVHDDSSARILSNLRASQATERPCGMQWHAGTIAPVNHMEPDGPTGWSGVHGELTNNPSGICDECTRDWRENYPRYALPAPLPVPGTEHR